MRDFIEIYADGACLGNPGPMGIGIYFKYGRHEKKISKLIGNGTNNIAEMSAIYEALLTIKNKELPIIIYTDSQYAQKVLSGAWSPKANIELVNIIKGLICSFPDLQILWVRGHNGNAGNEIADVLANEALRAYNG